MARKRVHELAKEFGISSKEMLEKLREMNIPAKNHASTLVDAYVDKIRKKLGPELEQKHAEEEAAKAAETEKAAREASAASKAAAAADAATAKAAETAEAAEVAETTGAAKAAETAEAKESKKAEETTGTEEAASAKEGKELAEAEEAAKADANDAKTVKEEATRADTKAVPRADEDKKPAKADAKDATKAAGTKESAKATMNKTAETTAAEWETKKPAVDAARGNRRKPKDDRLKIDGEGRRKAPEEGRRRVPEEGRRKTPEEGRRRVPEESRRKAPEEKRREGEEKRGKGEEGERIKREDGKAARDRELAARARERKSRPVKTDKPKKKILTSSSDSGFGDLLSRIEAESKRLDVEKAAKKQAEKERKEKERKEKAAAKKAQDTRQNQQAKQTRESQAKDNQAKGNQTRGSQARENVAERTEGQKTSGKRRRGKGKDNTEDGRRGRRQQTSRRNQNLLQNQIDLDLALEEINGDRYSQMAENAEKLQRQRILDEARAAVDAASRAEGQGRRRKRKEKREALAKKRIEEQALEKGIDPSLMLDDSVVQITTGSTVAEVSDALGVSSSEVIKKLFLLGTPLTLTQTMSDDMIELIADDMGRRVRIVSPEEEYEIAINDSEEDLKPRPPVVTVMGHVDHGKTSLLDAIRKTGVVETEAGGITQAIGASIVEVDGRQITFIDTPGHEAFTAMRARGAKITDVVVLVVAADDGVMPQTIEAINHAKAANVPIVVAVNKIDKPGANPDRVRQELTEYGIIPEEWGGQNMFVNVSAKQNLNIDELLETILLQADVLELKANPDALASGFVIEANLDKGRGSVATVLVQRGTLRVGDAIVAGTSYGHVRALINPKGVQVDSLGPSDPAEILGLGSVPAAGDEFRVFEDERDARNLAEDRALRARLADQQSKVPVTLDDWFNRIEEGKLAELNLVLKADTQGSIEALKDAFEKMDQSEVRIKVIHSAVGGITETDVILAAASDAIIIGFGVRPQTKAKQLAEKEKVEIRTYRIIYKAIEDINDARVGLLKPDIVERETATLEVREIFKVPKVGSIAGCIVNEGEVGNTDKIRVVRDGAIIHEGSISSLRRFKDDVKSVRAGYECGLGIEAFQDIKPGDVLESFKMVEIARGA